MKHLAIRLRYFFTLVIFLLSPAFAFASWNGQPYNAGQTLNPECAPTDQNCTVSVSPGSTQWDDNGSSTIYYNGGPVGIGTASPAGELTVVGSSTYAITDGNNLVADPSFNNGGWSSSGEDWNIGDGSATHSNSDYSTLEGNLNVDSTVSGDSYIISFQVTGRTHGYVKVGFGGNISTVEFAGNGTSDFSYYTQIVQSDGESVIDFHPSSDFDGTISNVSAYHITQNTPTISLLNTDQSVGAEIRTGQADGSLGSEFFGTDAGAFNQGYDTSGIGSGALQYNTANRVSAIGWDAGQYNSGPDLAAFGTNAAQFNSGNETNAFGVQAGYYNTATDLAAFGSYAGYQNTGTLSSEIGYAAGAFNTGNTLSALGYYAGENNTGFDLNAFGDQAAEGNTGNHVSAIGTNAAENNTGNNVNAIGNNAAEQNTRDEVNAFGNGAAQNNTGTEINAIGDGAASNNSGSGVTAIGAGAAINNTGFNVNAIGIEAASNNTGDNVDAIGSFAIAGKTGGNGVAALGSDDSGLGFFSGTQRNIQQSLILGPSSLTNISSNQEDTLTNIVAVGGRATQSNQAILGNLNTSQTLLHGSVNIGTTTSSVKLAVEGSHQINFTKNGSYLPSGAQYRDAFLVGTTLYVADQNTGLDIFDVSNPSNPQLLATSGIEGYLTGIYVSGNLAYGMDNNYLVVWDITDPRNPQFVGGYYMGQNNISSLYVNNGMLYVSASNQLLVYDVSQLSLENNGDPAVLAYTNVGSTINSVTVDGGMAYLATSAGLLSEDVSGISPGNPGSIYDEGFYSISNAWDVAVSQGVAYVVSVDASITALSLANGGYSLQYLDSVRLDSNYYDYMHIKVVGSYAYVSDGEYDSVFAAYIADPTNIEFAGHYAGGDNSFGLAVSPDGKNVYVANYEGGLIDLSTSVPQTTVASFTNGNVHIGNVTGSVASSTAALNVAGLGGTDGLKFVSTYTAPHGANTPTAVVGTYEYIPNYQNGFDIVDISSPYKPVTISSYVPSETYLASGPVVQGKYAYFTDNTGAIEQVDISDPLHPTNTGQTYTSESGFLTNIQASGSYLYALNNNSQIEIVNIAVPTNMFSVGTITSELTGSFGRYIVSGSHLFAVNDSGDVEIYGVSNPQSPTYINEYTPEYGSAGMMNVLGNYLYIRVDQENGGTLEIVDISDINNPTYVGHYNSSTYYLGDFAVKSNYIYEQNDNGQLEVIDATHPANPVFVSNITSPTGWYGTPFISGSYLYAANDDGQVEAIDVSNPRAPIAAVFTSGRVGVGTTDPTASFSVVGQGGDTPVLKSTYQLANGEDGMFVLGNYMYLLRSDDSNLDIIDLSNPSQLSTTGTYSIDGYMQYPFVEGNMLYVNADGGYIQAIDVSNPANPTFKSSITAQQGGFGHFTVEGNMLYAVDSEGYLESFDISSSTNITFVQQYQPDGNPLDLARPVVAAGNYVYSMNQSGENVIVTNVSATSSYSTASVVGTNDETSVGGFALSDSSLYILNSSYHVEVFNASIPEDIYYEGTYAGQSTLSIDPNSPGESGYLFAADSCNIDTVNVLNPNSPTLTDTYTSPTGCVEKPFIANGYAYAIDDYGNLEVLDISNIAHPTSAATFTDGRVGINTVNPAALLDVNGNAVISGFNRYLNFGNDTSGSDGYGLRDNNGTMQFKNNGGDWTNMGSGGTSQWTDEMGGVSYDPNDSGGEVAIGGVPTGLLKLFVNGDASVGNLYVGEARNDATNGAPWYGIGQSTFSIPGTQNNADAVQVAGYYGLRLVTSQTQITLNQFGSVGIGTDSPDSSALLDLSSNSKGLLPPRMTQVQRDAISYPAVGLVIFNTDSNTLQYYAAPTNLSVAGDGYTSQSGAYATQAMGETITPTNNGPLISIQGQFAARPTFGLDTSGDQAQASVVAKIYDRPNGDLLATSDNMVTDSYVEDDYNSFVAGTWTFTNAHFTLQANTQYYVEFTDSDTQPNELYFGESGGNPYSGGESYDGVHGSVSPISDYDLDIIVSYGITLNGGWEDVGGGWQKSDNSSNIFFENGNVGIGTTTPTSALEVNGDIRISDGSGGRLYFGDGSSVFTATAAGTGIESDNDLNFITGGQINFGTGDGESTTTKLVITNDGSVGIGTTNPDAPLSIVSQADGNPTLLSLTSTADFFDQGPAISFKDGFMGDGGPGIETARIQTLAIAPGAAGLGFDVTYGGEEGPGTVQEAMRIEGGSGFVGIGRMQPETNLDVAGSEILSGENNYLNFGGDGNPSNSAGSNGYGFRDNSGVMQFKNENGDWTDIATSTGGGGGADLTSATDTPFGFNYSGTLYSGDPNWGLQICSTNDCLVDTNGADNFEARLKYWADGTGDRRAGIYDSALSDYTIYSNGSTTPNIIIPTGNLGILTTDPQYALDVNGTARATSFLGADFGSGNSHSSYSVGAIAASGRVTFYGNPFDGDQVTMSDGTHTVVFEFDNDSINDHGSDVLVPINSGSIFATMENFLNAVSASDLTFTADEHIYSSQYINFTNTTAGAIGNQAIVTTGFVVSASGMSGGSDATTASYSGFTFGGDNTLGADNAFVIGNGITDSVANSLQIGTGDSAKITILSDGNVGIGTASPTSALTVNYDEGSYSHGGITLMNTDGGNWPAYITLGNPGETSTISAGNGSDTFVIQAGGSGGVALTSGDTSWHSASDARLKTNIQDLSGSSTLDKILALDPVSFNWIDPKMSTTTQDGFLAQDVLKLFPELVSVPADPSKCAVGNTLSNCYGLIYDRFGVLAIAAIKDLAGITGTFKANLIAWLGDAANGIDKLFVTEIHTKEICVAKSDGSEVCLTGDQLQTMMATSGATPIIVPFEGTSSPSGDSSGQGGGATSTDATSTDDTNATSSVEYSDGNNASTTPANSTSGATDSGTGDASSTDAGGSN